jgi:hypothetical protein
MASEPQRRHRKPRPHPAEVFNDLYDSWQIPVSDEPGAPLVTSLHDGVDWVQVHAPREFFQRLADELAQGRLADVEKWLMVWGMERKELDRSLCGSPTRRGIPCHFTRPCRHHPTYRRAE